MIFTMIIIIIIMAVISVVINGGCFTSIYKWILIHDKLQKKLILISKKKIQFSNNLQTLHH